VGNAVITSSKFYKKEDIMNKSIKLFITASAAVMLSACATAPGAKFSGITTPEKSRSDIYLYRTNALFSMGSAFDVALDNQKVGKLYNASYLHLRLNPGSHSIRVSPGGLGKSSDLEIVAKPGINSFYEYDFVTGPLANAFFIGSSIKPRETAQALIDLDKLNSAD
jgi:hypothetical protein